MRESHLLLKLGIPFLPSRRVQKQINFCLLNTCSYVRMQMHTHIYSHTHPRTRRKVHTHALRKYCLCFLLATQARNLGIAGLVRSWKRFENDGWLPNSESFNILLFAHAKANNCGAV